MLGRAEGLMPQQFLDMAYIAAGGEQMCRESVPEAMGRNCGV